MKTKKSLKREFRRRAGAILLSLVVAVSMMPVFAFADEVPGADGQADAARTAEQAAEEMTASPSDAGYSDAGTLSTETSEQGQEAAAEVKAPEEVIQEEDAAAAEGPIAEESAGQAAQEENEDSTSADGAKSSVAQDVPEEETSAAEESEEAEIPEVKIPDVIVADSDELISGYIDKQVSEETGTEPVVQLSELADPEGASSDSETEADSSSAAPSTEEPESDTAESGADNTQASESGADAAEPDTDTVEVSSPTFKKDSAKMSVKRYSVLSAAEKAAYNAIAPQIQDIAAGKTQKAIVSFTTKDRDLDELVMFSLMLDMPYEFYWYDKTKGYLPVYKKNSDGTYTAKFFFNVSKDYSDPSVVQTVTHNGEVTAKIPIGLDAEKTARASAVAANVIDFLNSVDGYSDLEKLVGYATIICDEVSYDKKAAATGDEYYAKISRNLQADPFYGDPWQLINVFDGDDSTNVVCEGYAKAFQYLCDHTVFRKNIECYTVSSSNHMWNILHMDDGCNYLADLTNCDTSGTLAFFLRGHSNVKGSSVQTGYTYSLGTNSIKYKYSTLIKGGYVLNDMGYIVYQDPLYTARELTMAAADYDPDHLVKTRYAAKAATCTRAGTITYWKKGNYLFRDAYCSVRITKAQTVVKAKGHSWKNTVKSLDYNKQKCSACGKVRTVSKVVVDRPKVTIKKPSRAKKGFTVKWKKLSSSKRKKISGIEIQYSTSKKFKDSVSVVKKAKKTAKSKKITKLKKKKTYYVRIRTYKWINGKKHVSKWSSVRKVKTK